MSDITIKDNSDDPRFTNINPEDLPPDLLPFYKSMQKDYTQKRQAESERVKAAEENAKLLQQKYEEVVGAVSEKEDYVSKLEDANLKWQQWYEHTQQEAANGNPSPEISDSEMRKMKGEGMGADQGNGGVEWESRINEIDTKYGRGVQELADNIAKLEKRLGFSLQLSELSRQYGNEYEIDPQKVVSKALELGTDNLTQAFNEAYKEDIFNKEVERRLENEKKKMEEANRQSVLGGEGRGMSQTFYTTPDAKPRSYEEATAQAIREESLL